MPDEKKKDVSTEAPASSGGDTLPRERGLGQPHRVHEVDLEARLAELAVEDDLGAAPGGWSQWIRQALSTLYPASPGRIIALDILEMPTLAGVEFLHGDFREDAVLSQLEWTLDGKPVDLVLSDMAPNKSGMDAVDQPRMMHLAELAMEFADRHLRVDGTLLIKLFQGVGFDDYVRELRRRYAKVAIRKPDASRKRSPEVYALALGKLSHPMLPKSPAGP